MPEEKHSPAASPDPAPSPAPAGDLREIEAARLADLLGAVLEDEGEKPPGELEG